MGSITSHMMKIRPEKYSTILKSAGRMVMLNSVISSLPSYASSQGCLSLLDLLMVSRIIKSRMIRQVYATTNSKMNPTEFIFLLNFNFTFFT